MLRSTQDLDIPDLWLKAATLSKFHGDVSGAFGRMMFAAGGDDPNTTFDFFGLWSSMIDAHWDDCPHQPAMDMACKAIQFALLYGVARERM